MAVKQHTQVYMKALSVHNYTKDGFVRLCKVEQDYDNKWLFSKINSQLMFDEHRSWVYFIVVDDVIVKVGESGNPLGVPLKNSCQPKTGTEGRIGRYRGGDGTDEYIRTALRDAVKAGKVSIWVRKCDIVQVNIDVAQTARTVQTTFHKHLEMMYLDYIFAKTGRYPELNVCRK